MFGASSELASVGLALTERRRSSGDMYRRGRLFGGESRGRRKATPSDDFAAATLIVMVATSDRH